MSRSRPVGGCIVVAIALGLGCRGLEPLHDVGTGDGGCLPAPNGIVSWWPGDDDPDDIVGPNTGTLVSGGYGPGVVNDAFSFDGGGYLQAPTSGLPTGTADRTLELWARVDDLVVVEGFFAGYGHFGANDATYQLGDRLGQVYFSQWGKAIFGPDVPLGTWQHVAAATTNGVTTLYLNGAVVGTATLPLSTPPSSTFYAGRIPGNLGDSRQLVGSVDEITLYDRALSIDELQAIVDAGVAGKCRP